MLTASGLSFAHGMRTLFEDVTLTLDPGRRIVVVGGNGVGKTTLLEIVVGLRPPDSGSVTRPNDFRIGYLPQETLDVPDATVIGHVLSGAGPAAEAKARLDELEAQLTRTSDAGGTGVDEKLLAAYGEAQARAAQVGAYQIEAEAHRVLAGLGFTPEDAERPVAEMSGGWRMRAALARLLVSDPDLLVLDEPTNHLDIDSVAWLAEYLTAYRGAVLAVSHDRDFVDDIATHVVELSGGRAHTYVGGFAEFVAEREERMAQQSAAAARQARQVAQTERFIERFRYKATKARQVQSRVKALEKLERIPEPTAEQVKARFGFPEPPRAPRVMARIEGADLGYGDTVVLGHVDLVVERGHRLALVGPNGAGKTTLIKAILGELAPMTGTAEVAATVQVAAFDQHQADTLNPDRTVLEEFRTVLPPGDRRNPRSLLGSFGFPGDDADRKVGLLSGGERTRLALGRIMSTPANLLVLDEPTNHLDLPSRDLLEDALRAYPGTFLLITHDRYLIRRVATDLVLVRDGRVRHVHGVDEKYLAGGGVPVSSPVATGPDRSGRVSDSGDRSNPKQRRRVEAAERRRIETATRELKRRVAAAERRAERAEAEVSRLEAELSDPAAYDDHQRLRVLADEHDAAKAEAATAMEEWEAATSALEAAAEGATGPATGATGTA